MAKRLTDKEKKEIIAYYIECQSLRETARKFNREPSTIKRVIEKDDETQQEIKQKATQKRNENTKSVLETMESKKDAKISLLNKILEAMEKKVDNLDMFTSIKDLATAYGIILDKEIKIKELENKNKDNQDVLDRLDKLLEEQKNA